MKKLLMVTAAVLAMSGAAQAANYKSGTYNCHLGSDASKGTVWKIAAPNADGLPLIELVTPGMITEDGMLHSQPSTTHGYGVISELPAFTAVTMMVPKHHSIFFEKNGTIRMSTTPCYPVVS